MNTIDSIGQLIAILNESKKADHPEIFKRLDLNPEDCLEFASWKGNGYTRNALAVTDDYEIVMLCWEGQTATEVHDHGGKDCWIYQVQGTITEKRYRNADGKFIELSKLDLRPQQLIYINDQMGYHNLENNTDERAISLHIYVSPIKSCRVFNKERQAFETKTMEYDATHLDYLVGDKSV